MVLTETDRELIAVIQDGLPLVAHPYAAIGEQLGLGEADVMLVMGCNTTEAHPIIGIELKKAARNGTKVIVVDPRRIKLVDHAHDWLRIQPGANVMLVNSMMKIIIDEGLADEEFIAERTEDANIKVVNERC